MMMAMMLMMMMMKMMMKMIILSKIGWPSVVGVWGASANNATGCLTHSRTHARIAVTRSQSRCLHMLMINIIKHKFSYS